VCQNLLFDLKFFQLLFSIDVDLADKTRAEKCACGGGFYCADYPRKPRGCPPSARHLFASRFSFCCRLCRKRTTAVSVRFLGRRVYLAVILALMPARRAKVNAGERQLRETLAVPARTLSRWRAWWIQIFPITPLWQAQCARFMPPVETTQLPPSLLVRFVGSATDSIVHILRFLTPLTVRNRQAA